ncbi:MAG TPA: hypothetical protein DCY93_03890 [Firmicutes bacterium]|nr:hypothetical protein [Bacillota bacterium]
MKIALLIDDKKILTDFDNKSTMVIYECYGELRSFVFKKDIFSFREFYEISYLQKVDCVLLSKITHEQKRKLEDIRMNYFIMPKEDVDSVFDDFFHFDRKRVDYRSELAEHQQFPTPFELSHDFNIGYVDDDDIGGS